MNQQYDIVGSELKFNVSINPISSLHMEDLDFKCEFFPNYNGRDYQGKNDTLRKIDMRRVDADNYICIVDSSLLGAGDVFCKITAYIPDNDCVDGYRTEVLIVPAGTTLVSSYADLTSSMASITTSSNSSGCISAVVSRICDIKSTSEAYLIMENGKGFLLKEDGGKFII